MKHTYRAIVLTGASSGIGAALATALARPGVRFLLTARNAARLEDVAESVRALGAEVETVVLDVTDTSLLDDRLRQFDASWPVDLVIANAGVSAGLGPDRSPEAPGTARRLIETNLLGAIATVEPLLPAMLERRHGHVALVSSLAALHPHADMPSYSASKAGLRAWGASIRQWLGPRGIHVTVICPGFVTTPLSERHRGWKPFEIDAKEAATRIVRGLNRRAPLITFPRRLALLVWLGQRLPPKLGDIAARGFGAVISPD